MARHLDLLYTYLPLDHISVKNIYCTAFVLPTYHFPEKVPLFVVVSIL